MTRLDWRGKLLALPAQMEGLRAAVGLRPEDTDTAAWAVLPDGSRRRASAAIVAALDQLLPGGAPLLSTMYRLPVARPPHRRRSPGR